MSVQKRSRSARVRDIQSSATEVEAQLGSTSSRLHWITCTSVGVVALLVYMRTLSPGMQMGDGTELAMCAQVLGVPHPTGYPLYMLLMKLWLLLTMGGEVIVRTSFLNAILMGAAAAFVTRITIDLLARLLPEWTIKSRLLAAAAAGLGTAFLRFHWENAVVTEVYALEFLLMIVFVRVAQLAEAAWKPRYVIGCALLVGLGLAHHRMSVFLLLPLLGIAVIAWRANADARRVSAIAAGIAALLLPLALYAYLPMRATVAPIHWGNTRTLSGFLDHVRGSEYLARSLLRPSQGRSFTADTYITFASRETAQIGGDFAGQFAPVPETYYYDQFVQRIFLAPGASAILLLLVLLPFAISGGVRWWHGSRAGLLVSASIAAQNLLILYIYNILDIRDYYLFPMWFGWMCFWFGLLAAINYVGKRRGVAAPGLAYACLLAPLIIGFGNQRRCDESSNNSAELLSDTILPNLPNVRPPADADVLPNSILLTGSDFDSFTSWYRQLVRSERTDVLIFATNFIWKPWYASYFTPEQVQKYHLKFASDVARGPAEFAEQVCQGVIDANITSTPIYSSMGDPLVLQEISKKYRVRPVAQRWIEQDRTAVDGTTITLYRIEPRT
jgi:hypothetical protein